MVGYKVWLAAIILACSAGVSAAPGADGNAIGGSAVSALDNTPLFGVRVEVAQAQQVNDMTRDPDGVYTLKVPTSIKEFDLRYVKDGYLDWVDPKITNDQDHQKRPVARLVPKLGLSTLSDTKILSLAVEASETGKRGQELSATDKQAGAVLVESAQKNLKLILNESTVDSTVHTIVKASMDNISKFSQTGD